MAMPKNKAVKVVRIAYDPEMATTNINDAIVEIENAGGTEVSIAYLATDTVILAYTPADGDGGNDGEDIDDGGDGGNDETPDTPDDNNGGGGEG